MSVRLILLSAVCLFLLACAPNYGSVRWQDGSDASLPYKRVLTKWTRSAAAYEGLETRFFVQSTCLSPNFIDALARERATRADLIPREAESIKQNLRQRERDELRFFLVLETREPHWDDLDQRDPSLKVRLFPTEGDRFVEPTKIERVTNNEMADLRVLFPYAGPSTTGYWITFPKQEKPIQLRLQVGGTPASVDLIWSIAPKHSEAQSTQVR